MCCALTAETHHLLNADRLRLLKSNAYLINVARGPIIDQGALTVALSNRQFAGAGLDVFDVEPISPDDPLLSLDNVILSPHAICWTDECFAGIGRSACQSLIDVAAGRVPDNVVNRDVLTNSHLVKKLELRRRRKTIPNPSGPLPDSGSPPPLSLRAVFPVRADRP